MNTVACQVPATTANLGPGFDALGVAVCLYNKITVSKSPAPAPLSPFFQEVSGLFFNTAGLTPSGYEVSIAGQVPQSRGLGSSVTVRLGLLMALNHLHHSPLSNEAILDLTIRLEGHPDNAVPAMVGGFCVTNGTSRYRAEVSGELKFVAIIPEHNLDTATARKVLPEHIDFTDAIKNIQHTALITAAFASGDYRQLRGHFQDCLHQPYRLKLMPGAAEAIAAAGEAGALGAYLSGAGSTLMALTLERENEVAQAMSQALLASGNAVPAIHHLQADNQGARIIDE